MLDISFIEKEIMPWAEHHEPVNYARTLGVKNRPGSYRIYMQRLVELRYEQDTEWDPPLRLLEDTSIDALFTLPDGREFHVQGRRCPGLRRMSWDLLARIIEEDHPTDALDAAVKHLDLFVKDDDPKKKDLWAIPDIDDPAAQDDHAAASLAPVDCPVCRVRPLTDGRYTCTQCADSKRNQRSFL